MVGRRRTNNDPANVVVSGWQVYDNKGRAVEQFEPFFAQDWDFRLEDDARGQKTTMVYDARGQLTRTITPDGSEQLQLHGRPEDVTVPELFLPSPWETFNYDQNDNAGRTHSRESQAYASHWNTPSSVTLDPLNRPITSTHRNGSVSTSDLYTTRTVHDIRGNILEITDALGSQSLANVYDLRSREKETGEKEPLPALKVEQLDAGTQWVFYDAAGNELERRNSRQTLILRAYDEMGRPWYQWARDEAGEAVTLREKLVYGDDAQSEGLDQDAARSNNLLGRLYRHYDEAGRITYLAYDFKGNLTEKIRQVIQANVIRSAFATAPPDWQVEAWRVDWEPPPGRTWQDHKSSLLDPVSYQISIHFDALNRPQQVLYPRDVEGRQKNLKTVYNQAGALKQLFLDGDTYVQHIAYNAKGQRTLVAYGNGILTRYAYDPKTFRMARMRSERFSTPPGDVGYQPSGVALQDMAYGYDTAGNVRTIRHQEPGCGIPNTVQGQDVLDRVFDYDPLYRLISATGRECDVLPVQPWNASPRDSDLTRTRAYTESYRYDPLGNLMALDHAAADGGSYRRRYTLAASTNQLATMEQSGLTYKYDFDTSGNMVQENNERHFEWDHSDRLRVFRIQPAGADPSVHAHYLYNGDGERVLKVVRKQGGRFEVTVYVDELFEHHLHIQASTTTENNTLHVMDGDERIASLRVGSSLSGAQVPALTHILDDHVGSSNLLVDGTGNWVNREEYTPYGETAFGGHASKRYRFAGKERYNESGLGYWQARYLHPATGRFLSTDPQMSTCPYAYAGNSPLTKVDPDGGIELLTISVLVSAVATTQHIWRPLLIRFGSRTGAFIARQGPRLWAWLRAVRTGTSQRSRQAAVRGNESSQDQR